MSSLEPMTPSIFVVKTGFSRVLGNDADVNHDERTGLKAVPTSGMSDGVGDSGSSRGRRPIRKNNRHAPSTAPRHDDGRRTMVDGWRGYADGDGGFRMASLEPMTPSIFVVETGFSRVLGNDADVDHDERTGLKAVPTSGMSDGVGDSGLSRGRRPIRGNNRLAEISAPHRQSSHRQSSGPAPPKTIDQSPKTNNQLTN